MTNATNIMTQEFTPNGINFNTFVDMLNFGTDFLIEGISAMRCIAAALFYKEAADALYEKTQYNTENAFYQNNRKILNRVSEHNLTNRYYVHLNRGMRLLTTVNARYKELTDEFFILRKIKKTDEGEFIPSDSLTLAFEFRDAFNNACPSLNFESFNWNEVVRIINENVK